MRKETLQGKTFSEVDNQNASTETKIKLHETEWQKFIQEGHNIFAIDGSRGLTVKWSWKMENRIQSTSANIYWNYTKSLY